MNHLYTPPSHASPSAQSLSASVSSLRTSLSLLDSSISILDAGVADFPRLKKVLASTRHFELTPSTSLTAAQKSLHSELVPAITTLLTRTESVLDRLERREKSLIARAELLEGRLESSAGQVEGRRKAGGGAKVGAERKAGAEGKFGAEPGDRERRLKALRAKKERLGYAVERLGLQSTQKQRQLRMSVGGGLRREVEAEVEDD